MTRRFSTTRPFRSTPCIWNTFLARSTPRISITTALLLVRNRSRRRRRAVHAIKWKARYGGLEVSEARRLKALEDENAKLKRLLAEAMLDNAALKDLVRKN